MAFGMRFLLACVVVAVSTSMAMAQVIQLPSFHTFSYSGSVLVPDSATASLGSVSRSASSYRGRGFGSSIGRGASHAGGSVTATIIDHREIDRQLLGESVTSTPSIDRTEEGKSLVRHARAMLKSGNRSAASVSYQMAIQVLDGRLKELATIEFRRVLPPTDARSVGDRLR
ncbi:hypothetical protein Poly51_08870 [Rubripirellula tenax]|uniref:Uncharacterized protein n=1 Tax=Rubripirellula tenax TaxID=2528015 RepID=A0A5C6FKM4_9BACT|nr:hypothetical protein [Rubripirellula tenax]TWU60609.1 hypothetical protein Poly51_08870 [Rubripirellula tenax]